MWYNTHTAPLNIDMIKKAGRLIKNQASKTIKGVISTPPGMSLREFAEKASLLLATNSTYKRI